MVRRRAHPTTLTGAVAPPLLEAAGGAAEGHMLLQLRTYGRASTGRGSRCVGEGSACSGSHPVVFAARALKLRSGDTSIDHGNHDAIFERTLRKTTKKTASCTRTYLSAHPNTPTTALVSYPSRARLNAKR